MRIDANVAPEKPVYPASNFRASLVFLESKSILILLFFSDLHFLTWQIQKSIDN